MKCGEIEKNKTIFALFYLLQCRLAKKRRVIKNFDNTKIFFSHRPTYKEILSGRGLIADSSQ